MNKRELKMNHEAAVRSILNEVNQRFPVGRRSCDVVQRQGSLNILRDGCPVTLLEDEVIRQAFGFEFICDLIRGEPEEEALRDARPRLDDLRITLGWHGMMALNASYTCSFNAHPTWERRIDERFVREVRSATRKMVLAANDIDHQRLLAYPDLKVKQVGLHAVGLELHFRDQILPLYADLCLGALGLDFPSRLIEKHFPGTKANLLLADVLLEERKSRWHAELVASLI